MRPSAAATAAPDALGDDELASLAARGFFVRDGFVGDEAARRAHAAAEALEARGALAPAGTSRAAIVDGRVRGDRIAWLARAGAPAELAPILDGFARLGDAVRRDVPLALGRHDVQLALYPSGGAAYARHLDAFAGASPSARRRLTTIVYLNPGWRPGLGGELRLHTGDGPVDVAPTLDRLVVFLAERVEHEVLPSRFARFAVTAWFYGPD